MDMRAYPSEDPPSFEERTQAVRLRWQLDRLQVRGARRVALHGTDGSGLELRDSHTA